MRILLLQLTCAWFLAGVIWVVQVVHYPLFAHVGVEEFVGYEALHAKWITYVVALPMLMELTASGLWLLDRDPRISQWIPWVGIGLVLTIWFATFALIVPCHNRLMDGFDEAAWSTLVGANWIRTAGWTLRGGVLLLALHQVAPGPNEALTSTGSSQKLTSGHGE